jgi:hypothetical protein
MQVLHICPHSVADPQQRYLGSTKDIRGRTEYFQTHHIPYTEVLAVWRSDDLLLGELVKLDLKQYSAVIVEMPLYPKSIRYIRQHAAHAKVFTRPINPEFYHQVHIALARGRNRFGEPSKTVWQANLETLRNSLRRLRLDYECARLSDGILSITDWEQTHYWQYLAGRQQAWCVPYYLPTDYVQASVAAVKKDQCVCLTSTMSNPMLLDAVHNFCEAVRRLGTDCPNWAFPITGTLPLDRYTLPERAQLTGLLETPVNILAESRAIAILSDLGFGFKTKLLDAIQAGCYILLPQKLFNRLPAEVQPYCLVVDPYSAKSFATALQQTQQPYPGGDPNSLLQMRAFAALDKALAQ